MTFNSSSTWTVPAGTTRIVVDIWGAGGGCAGGVSGAPNVYAGNGGSSSISGLSVIVPGGTGGQTQYPSGYGSYIQGGANGTTPQCTDNDSFACFKNMTKPLNGGTEESYTYRIEWTNSSLKIPILNEIEPLRLYFDPCAFIEPRISPTSA